MFELFRKKDINQGVEEWRSTEGAILLDVRTKEEYRTYHIDGSINIPLQTIDETEMHIGDKNKRIYVYCQSGVRSASAFRFLKKAGFSDVIDIGGISAYRGSAAKAQ